MLFAFIFNLTYTYAQEKGTAKVLKIDELDVFIYSEPLTEYEVLDRVTTFWNFGRNELGWSFVDDIVQTIIKRASKKNKNFDKKGGDTADCIVIDNNSNEVMIRYRKLYNAAITRKDARDEAPILQLSPFQKKIQLQQTLSVGPTGYCLIYNHVLSRYYYWGYKELIKWDTKL